ncbi:MAG: hypothetical protein RLY86_480 [Pseudomonadota bacterium]
MADLDEITDFVMERSVTAALKLAERIENSVLPAADHPYLFRPGRIAGTREIVAHPNYIVVYRVEANFILVVSVIHARQQYP